MMNFEKPPCPLVPCSVLFAHFLSSILLLWSHILDLLFLLPVQHDTDDIFLGKIDFFQVNHSDLTVVLCTGGKGVTH